RHSRRWCAVKNLLRVLAILIATFFAISSQARSSMQAAHVESAQATPTGTPEAKTEAGKPGQALAERSSEAAGKEEKGGDEEEKLKESASVRWIAQKTGMSPRTAYWVFVIFNF